MPNGGPTTPGELALSNQGNLKDQIKELEKRVSVLEDLLTSILERINNWTQRSTW